MNPRKTLIDVALPQRPANHRFATVIRQRVIPGGRPGRARSHAL